MTVDAQLTRNLLYSFSGLSFGAAFYALVIHVLLLPTDWRRHLAYICVKLAWFSCVGAVFWTIIRPLAEIEPTSLTYVYFAGLVFASFGFVGVARDARHWKDYVTKRGDSHASS